MADAPTPAGPQVVFETTAGDITIGLHDDKVPTTVKNFLHYVKSGFYEGLIFHRVIKGFVVQGGGVEPSGKQRKATKGPINLEINPALKHRKGSVSMARTMDPHSATSQFYICHGAQPSLDNNYAVFGEVIDGYEVVDKIAKMPTDREDRPRQDVAITRAYVK